MEQEIKKHTLDLLKTLSFDAKVEVSKDGEVYLIKIITEDNPSLLIGRHGQMLRSLSRVLSVILFQQLGQKIELNLDINDYREGQKKHLEEVAEKHILRLQESGSPVTLRHFSSYERKIIHEYITSSHPELASHSEGEGEERILIIENK